MFQPEGWILVAIGVVLVVTATSLVKCWVVFGALRLGLGAGSILGMPVVAGLAFLTTALVMGPSVEAVAQRWPDTGTVATWDGLVSALQPLRDFVAHHADAKELAFFAELRGRGTEDPLVQVSAFFITELREALTMAVVILTPLVLVDLLVAQLLLLAGWAAQSSPWTVVVPVKLLLFLAVGGWDVVVGGLVQGYR